MRPSVRVTLLSALLPVEVAHRVVSFVGEVFVRCAMCGTDCLVYNADYGMVVEAEYKCLQGDLYICRLCNNTAALLVGLFRPFTELRLWPPSGFGCGRFCRSRFRRL